MLLDLFMYSNKNYPTPKLFPNFLKRNFDDQSTQYESFIQGTWLLVLHEQKVSVVVKTFSNASP